MTVSAKIRESMERSSWIRKMFEEGIRLKAEYGAENVFDFSLGNPDLPPPARFADTVKDLIEQSAKSAHGYMPNAGFPDARETIAKRVSKEQGVDIKGSHLIASCGAAGGLNVVLKTILDPGDEVVVIKPYFAEYGFYIDNHGGKMVLAGSNADFSLNIDAIRKAMGPKTRAVLINSPNNPTGRVYGEAEVKALSQLVLDFMKETGRAVYLVADEPYRDIVYDGVKVPPLMAQCSQAIVVSSYSKTLSIPGERIGYIAVHPDVKEADSLLNGLIFCTRILGFVNAPALMQRAVARLTDVTVDVDTYKKRRDILVEGLSSAGYTFAKPEGAFYIFAKSPMADDVEFVRHLQKSNVLVVPGVGFGGPGYFRIAYCVAEDVIRRAIPRFKEGIESIKS